MVVPKTFRLVTLKQFCDYTSLLRSARSSVINILNQNVENH